MPTGTFSNKIKTQSLRLYLSKNKYVWTVVVESNNQYIQTTQLFALTATRLQSCNKIAELKHHFNMLQIIKVLFEMITRHNNTDTQNNRTKPLNLQLTYILITSCISEENNTNIETAVSKRKI